jgi:hypothetical protein
MHTDPICAAFRKAATILEKLNLITIDFAAEDGKAWNA